MSNDGPVRDDVDAALIAPRARPSIIWVIPLVAALVGGFVAWRAISERGPEVTIHFASAEGLEAGKTKVKYKDVEVGLVESIELTEDLSGVEVHVRMAKEFAPQLTERTRFWVVHARVSGGQISGLGTLFSGAYIGVDPVSEGEATRSFEGLDVPPVVTADEPGRHFVLHSFRAGALSVGTPVFYRKIEVGEVVSSELAPSGEFVEVRVFVDAPHHERVGSETRFWNASGFDVAMSAEGVQVDTESLASILIGGVAFDTPSEATGEPAAEDTVFTLYENRAASERRVYERKIVWQLHFDHSVRGLVPGSPVEFRGIPVGRVRDLHLEIDGDAGKEEIRIPVIVEIEPERFGRMLPDGQRREALDRLVARGLRAQLARGSLLTGQLVVALDIHANAPPAEIVWQEPYPEMPTLPTPMDQISDQLTQVVQKIGDMPFEQIGAELRASLASVSDLTRQLDQEVLPQLTKTLEGTSAMVGSDSALNEELRRTLFELTEAARALGLVADQLEREPESLIRGRE